MTNYMGKRRLEKILLQMLSDRPELAAQVKAERDFVKYRTYKGSEWLTVPLIDYLFKISATRGVVVFDEYRLDQYGDAKPLYNEIITHYNEVFEPLPLTTWFSGGCELRKRGYYPFQNDEDAVGLDSDAFVCYDIAKRVSKREVAKVC